MNIFRHVEKPTIIAQKLHRVACNKLHIKPPLKYLCNHFSTMQELHKNRVQQIAYETTTLGFLHCKKISVYPRIFCGSYCYVDFGFITPSIHACKRRSYTGTGSVKIWTRSISADLYADIFTV